ncbi:MAG: hypothetical protein AB2541_09295 [Candidatus Thiodiazotropha sp.]
MITLFRGLPKEMFINRILLNEASCEIKLGEIRSSLFEYIKDSEDWPYGLQCMLKRRIYTRNGDPVPVKFAQDIHTLISVLEGAEYSEIKDLLSGSGVSQRSQSVSGSANITLGPCEFSAEIKELTDDLKSLKADVLNLKQKQLAIESTRSKELMTLKSTVLGIKSDLTIVSTAVTKAVTDIELCAQRIESEKSLGVVNLKNEIRIIRDNMKSMQDVIDQLPNGSSSGGLSAQRRGKSGRKNRGGQGGVQARVDCSGSSPVLPGSSLGGGAVGAQFGLAGTVKQVSCTNDNRNNDCYIVQGLESNVDVVLQHGVVATSQSSVDVVLQHSAVETSHPDGVSISQASDAGAPPETVDNSATFRAKAPGVNNAAQAFERTFSDQHVIPGRLISSRASDAKNDISCESEKQHNNCNTVQGFELNDISVEVRHGAVAASHSVVVPGSHAGDDGATSEMAGGSASFRAAATATAVTAVQSLERTSSNQQVIPGRLISSRAYNAKNDILCESDKQHNYGNAVQGFESNGISAEVRHGAVAASHPGGVPVSHHGDAGATSETIEGYRSYRDVVAAPAVNVVQSVNGGISSHRIMPGRLISTRVTRNVGPSHGSALVAEPDRSGCFSGYTDDDDDDFLQFVKKKARRYYLGGFKPTVTHERIRAYVTRRGPTVTWIRIWHSKRNPNNVVVRLNVEDNSSAHRVEGRSFWPPGVICKPWVNRSERHNERQYSISSQRSDYEQVRSSTFMYGRSDIDDYNPYSPLRDDANID